MTDSLEQEREALWLRVEELTGVKFINHKEPPEVLDEYSIRSRLTFCPSGHETENGSLELLEVENRLIHKWTLRYHAPFSLNLARIGFGLTSPIIKSLSGKDCSRVYPK